MAELAGNLNVVYILAGTTPMAEGTGAAIKGVDNSSFGKLCDILEITAFGDASKKRKGGLKDTTFTLSGNRYTGDTTGQDILIPGNDIYIGAHPAGKSVAAEQIPAIVESIEWSAEVAGMQKFTASIAANGAPVVMPAHT